MSPTRSAEPDHAPGTMSLDDRLSGIEKMLGDILTKLGLGSETMSTMQLRIRALEIIVYGAVFLVLVAVASGLVSKVVQPVSPDHPAAQAANHVLPP